MAAQGNNGKAAASAQSESGMSAFFKGVKREFAKIAWPGREDLTKRTWAVVSVSVVLGLIIAAIDRLVLYGLNFIIK